MQNSNYQYEYDEKLTLGEVQWQCLNTISKRYEGVSLNRLSDNAKFEDSVWPISVPLEKDITWDRMILENGLSSGQYQEDQGPLKLLCKIATYRHICVLGRNLSWYRSCQSFYNFFSETLRAKKILTGNKNEEMKPLSNLTCDDIKLAALLHLAKTNGKISPSPFQFLQALKDMPFEAIKEAPFFSITSELPWEEEGVTIKKWIDQLKISENHEVKHRKSYPPISLENVGKIVNSATIWLDNLEMLKDVFQIIKNDEEIRGSTRSRNVRKSVTDKIIAKHGLALNDLLKIRTKGVNKGSDLISYEIQNSWFTDLIRLAEGAAVWILLLTTGLRNVDVRKLIVGCCKPSNRSDLLNYLVLDIKKTGQKNYVLPVPSQTKLATELLESVRRDFESPYLVTSVKFNTSKKPNEKSAYLTGSAINSLLGEFLDHYEIPRVVSENDDTEATVHCVRATLAGWIGANSHMAILIVRKLFGHTNMLMPDAYLSHNPIIIKQRQENITKAQESLAEDMVDGMVNGKLSGTKGKQMLRGVEYVKDELRIECQSLTEMDMHVTLKERLKEMLMQRITGGDVFALTTPMGVVCMRSSCDTSDTPCAKEANHEKRRDKKISKEITDALGTLPNPGHCIGKDCSDAVLGEKWSGPLLETFEYYVNYLKGMGNQSIDIKFEAENFVKEYGPLLKEIYDEEVECFG